MRPQSRMGNPFGPGGAFNPRSVAAKLAIALIAVTVVGVLADRFINLSLLPFEVIQKFSLWQPVTYAFFETSPFGLIIGALIIWSMGGALEQTWGSKRLAMFAVGATVGAGVLTVLLSLLWKSLYMMPQYGGTVMTTAIWVAYGWSFGRMQMSFWGIPMTGNTLALIGVGFVALNAVFSRSLLPVIPDVFAIAITAAYVKLGSPRILILRLREWRLRRDLKARSKHLNVVRGGDGSSRGSDRYIH